VRPPVKHEVLTGPASDGPWTSVATFTSSQTKTTQKFLAASDAPALGGFVQVLVHDTYGGSARVEEMCLVGEHRARRAAPSRPRPPGTLVSAAPPRPIEHARVKRRALGQAVRGDWPGMQLQLREGPPRLSVGKALAQPPGNVPATVVIVE
jgi:hypothetical protein